MKTSCSCRWRGGGSSYDSYVIHPFSACIVDDVRQGWRTYGARKDFLGSRHSLLANVFFFISFARPASLYLEEYMYIYTYTYLSVCVETAYELLLLSNKTASETTAFIPTHIQTDGNDIRPHTIQTHNEPTSTEFNLVTAQSTAHEPPEDGGKYGPKHIGATSLKCFLNVFKCFKY